MPVNYILDDDLLRHLPHCDAAINLTTLYDPWKVGLTHAYAETYPKVYESFKEAQEDFSIKLGEAWISKENDTSPDVICISLKTSVSMENDIDIIKEVLGKLPEICKDYNDVIMPVIITGELEESMKLIERYLAKTDVKTNFWVGVSATRAKDKGFPKKEILFVSRAHKDLSPDKLKPAIKEDLGDSKLYKLYTKKNFVSAERLIHWCDRGYALIDETRPNIPFNDYIHSLIKGGLDVKFIP